jgi:hypothetical protein
VRLAEQWNELQTELPRGWDSASVELALDDPDAAARAALLLGPAAPVRQGSAFRIDVSRKSRAGATSLALFERLLERLDREGVAARLALASAAEAPAGDESRAPGPAAAQWDGLLSSLPPDWSHLLAQIDLDSSDYVERAALLMSQANPRLAEGRWSFYFRCARRYGYGVAPEMARRCFARLDEEGITGRISVVQVVSDAHPVATQGPVFRVAGKSV